MNLCEEFKEYEELWEAVEEEPKFAPDTLRRSKGEFFDNDGNYRLDTEMVDPAVHYGTAYSLGTETGALAYITAKTKNYITKLKKSLKDGIWTIEEERRLSWLYNIVKGFVNSLNKKGYAYGSSIEAKIMPALKEISDKAAAIKQKEAEDKLNNKVTATGISKEIINKHHESNMKIINILKRYTDLGNKVNLDYILNQLDNNRLRDYASNKWIAFGDDKGKN
jgi:hypothetical protein